MPVVACSKCGTKNRVDPHQAAKQIAKCGKCGTPLDLNNAAAAETKPLIVTDSTFQRDVIDASERPVLLDAWAPYLERLHDPMYGLGWRSYDYAGHHIVGHRGGVNGYRSLILFDPQLKSGVVALWNSNTNQPGGLEFEVLDMLYHLPFRDWMELDRGPAGAAPVEVETSDVGSGEAR